MDDHSPQEPSLLPLTTRDLNANAIDALRSSAHARSSGHAAFASRPKPPTSNSWKSESHSSTTTVSTALLEPSLTPVTTVELRESMAKQRPGGNNLSANSGMSSLATTSTDEGDDFLYLPKMPVGAAKLKDQRDSEKDAKKLRLRSSGPVELIVPHIERKKGAKAETSSIKSSRSQATEERKECHDLEETEDRKNELMEEGTAVVPTATVVASQALAPGAYRVRERERQSTSSGSSDTEPHDDHDDDDDDAAASQPPTERAPRVSVLPQIANADSVRVVPKDPTPTCNRKLYIGIAVLLLIIALAVGLGVGLAAGGNANGDNGGTDPTPTPEPTLAFPYDQCAANGTITLMSDEITTQYQDLLENFIPTILANFSETPSSCTSRNMALAWLASDTIESGITDATILKERFVLSFLYGTWSGDNWYLSRSWLSTVAACTWYGIRCENGNTITDLAIEKNNIVGTLPTELVILTDLVSVFLRGNELHGSIPTEYAQISTLGYIDFGDNNLDGSIPSVIGLLTDLIEVAFDGNSLTGTLPTEVGVLRSLTTFIVDDNKITGTFPTELWSLNRLTALGASYLLFQQASIPSTQIGNITNLQKLTLSDSGFGGTIPTELGLLTQLQSLVIDQNRFTGTLPTELGLCTLLKTLIVDTNHLTGTVPSQLGALINLDTLGVERNDITGTVPDVVCALRSPIGLTEFTADCTTQVVCSTPDCCTTCVA